MIIRLLDLQAQYVNIKSDIDSSILKIVESQQFILGSVVGAFEKSIETYHGSNIDTLTSKPASAAVRIISMYVKVSIAAGSAAICSSCRFMNLNAIS